MRMFFGDAKGLVGDGAFNLLGGVEAAKTGDGETAYVCLQFRLATNGVIVNTLVNDEPLITTSAGSFN